MNSQRVASVEGHHPDVVVHDPNLPPASDPDELLLERAEKVVSLLQDAEGVLHTL
jgi:hypothetical protein